MSLSWTNWEKIPNTTINKETLSPSTSNPVIVSTSPHDVNLLISDTNNRVFQTFWDGRNWYEWRPLGEDIRTISVVSRGPGLLDIVCLGKDNRLYHKAWDRESWVVNGNKITNSLEWGSPIGEPIGDYAPSIVSWGPKGSSRLDVFAIGKTGNLLHMFSDDGKEWFGESGQKNVWENLGGICTSPPISISRGFGHLDIFVGNTDRGITYKGYHPGGWTDWQSFPGTILNSPAVASRWGATLDVFGRTSKSENLSYHISHMYWDGQSKWGPQDQNGNFFWEDIGAPFTGGYFDGSPSVISRGENLLDIFGIGAHHPETNIIDRRIYHKAWDGKTWVPSNLNDEWSIIMGYNDLNKVEKHSVVAVDNNLVMVIASVRDESNLYYNIGIE